MAEVEKIQCPSCGSNSTYKLFDGNYKCNYCQSNFIVKDIASANKKRINPLQSNSSAPAKSNGKIIIFVAIAVFLFMGIGVATYLMKTISLTEALEDVPIQGKNHVIKMTKAFVGSEGAVVWIVSEHKYAVDSVWYEIFAVDPQTNLLKGKQFFIKEFKLGGSNDFYKKVGNVFWLFGDVAYDISDDNGLVGHNIYSGAEELNSGILSQKFPELKNGILKTEYNSTEHNFKITTNTGDVLTFNPLLKTISAKANTIKKNEDLPITTELYLTDGLKHQLYKLTKRGDGFPLVFNGFLQQSQIPELKNSKAQVEDIFGNKSIEKILDKNYFRAQPLVKSEDRSLVLLYKTTLSDNAEVVMESINDEGKTNWILKNPLFSGISKGFATEDLGCEYSYSKQVLILKLLPDNPIFMGIDIKTGKILWQFDPEKYMKETKL